MQPITYARLFHVTMPIMEILLILEIKFTKIPVNKIEKRERERKQAREDQYNKN